MSEIDIAPRGRAGHKRHEPAPIAVLSRDVFSRDRATVSSDSGARCCWSDAGRWWFHALDERRVNAGGAEWVAQVVGIHEVRPHLWIQLESADAIRRLVLHVTLETPLEDALDAIAASSGDFAGPEIVDARRCGGA